MTHGRCAVSGVVGPLHQAYAQELADATDAHVARERTQASRGLGG